MEEEEEEEGGQRPRGGWRAAEGGRAGGRERAQAAAAPAAASWASLSHGGHLSDHLRGLHTINPLENQISSLDTQIGIKSSGYIPKRFPFHIHPNGQLHPCFVLCL